MTAAIFHRTKLVSHKLQNCRPVNAMQYVKHHHVRTLKRLNCNKRGPLLTSAVQKMHHAVTLEVIYGPADGQRLTHPHPVFRESKAKTQVGTETFVFVLFWPLHRSQTLGSCYNHNGTDGKVRQLQ